MSRKSFFVRRRDIEAIDVNYGNFSDRDLLPWLASVVSPWTGTFCIDTSERVAALTYDDGPNPVHTEEVLDVLGEFKARATFFVLAQAAIRHPQTVSRARREGHEIGLHGEDHTSILSMSGASLVKMLSRSRSIVEAVAGERIKYYRPPYLQYSWRQLPIIRCLGLRLAMASGGADDWINDAESSIARRAISSLAPGAILVLHDDRADRDAVAAEDFPCFDRGAVTRQLLENAKERGFRMVPYGEQTMR